MRRNGVIANFSILTKSAPFAAAASCFLVFGCATPYRGGAPNFSSPDPATRAAERAQFELDDSFWTSGKYLRFKNGSTHTLDSMYRLVKNVSPLAAGEIEDARNWYYARFILAAISVSVAAGGLVTGPQAPGWVWVTAAGAGVGAIACGVIGAYTTSEIARRYNESLGHRLGGSSSLPLTPQFSIRFEY